MYTAEVIVHFSTGRFQRHISFSDVRPGQLNRTVYLARCDVFRAVNMKIACPVGRDAMCTNVLEQSSVPIIDSRL
jgi:hypothetical protein